MTIRSVASDIGRRKIRPGDRVVLLGFRFGAGVPILVTSVTKKGHLRLKGQRTSHISPKAVRRVLPER